MNNLENTDFQIICAANFESFDILKRHIEKRKMIAKSIISSDLKNDKEAIAIFNQSNIEILQVLGISKVYSGDLKEDQHLQFIHPIIEEQRKLNRIQSVNNFLAELINKDPDFPLEIAKRLYYNPLDTKNTDIEFNNNEFIEKQKYHDFVYETMVQLQTDQIDFAKAIQKLQDYKTY